MMFRLLLLSTPPTSLILGPLFQGGNFPTIEHQTSRATPHFEFPETAFLLINQIVIDARRQRPCVCVNVKAADIFCLVLARSKFLK